MKIRHWTPLVLSTVLCICVGCSTVPHASEGAAEAAGAPPTSAQAGETTIVAIAAPAAPGSQQTLPQYLGITGLAKGLYKGGCALNNCIRNELGMLFPGMANSLGMTPALMDPANMDPNAPPAVQAAAEIKAEEDGAAAKTAAIRYLAGIGCAGCYPGVEEALLAALDDCTESVRYEAVKAFRDAAGSPCTSCRSDSCCSPEVRKRLNEVANKTNSRGCFVESSPRVRRVARLALNACGGGVPVDSLPEEGPTEAPPGDDNLASAETPTGEVEPDAEEPMNVSSAVAILGEQEAASGQPALNDPAAMDDLVVARVDGEPIMLSQIRARMEQEGEVGQQTALLAEGNGSDTGTSFQAELERAVNNRLLSMEARTQLPPDEIARVAYNRPGAGTQSWSDVGLAGSEMYSVSADEAIADEWLKYRVRVPEECSRQEVYAYFRTHLGKYREPGQVRWEQMTARIDRFQGRDQARAALDFLLRATVGGESSPPVGVDLDAVAVETIDWTSERDLPVGVLGRTLTSLPIGKISPIISNNESLCLVRVLQRRNPSAPTLDEVAQVVRQDLLAERRQRAVQSHLRRLRQAAVVWTIHDEPDDRLPTDGWSSQAAVFENERNWNEQN